jgi:crotonobetainyl-CoA:carnitine CoA-transferase CaiB-like acyl-CoA transferase
MGSQPTDPGSAAHSFAGVRVVELAEWVFVPVAGTLLADWGADVVKIERPGGDGYRGLMSQGIGAGQAINVSWELANRGKRSLVLDLKAPEGLEVLMRLVGTADVFLTNLLPSALERLGLGGEALRVRFPRLIYARGHGYGVRGPDADKPAYDATAFWARGGIAETLAPAGLPEPLQQRGALGDRYGAVQIAFGIASALFRRERTGQGSIVDVSLLSTAMWMIGSDLVAAMQGKFRPSAASGHSAAIAPNPLAANYRCGDGRWLSLMCLQADRHWADVCRALELGAVVSDPRFADIPARGEHREECARILSDAFSRRTLDEWKKRLADERIPWAPFQRVTELAADPQVDANGYVAEVAVDGGESFRVPTGAVQFDGRHAAIRRAPEHGQHSEEILLELGMEWEEIAKLRRAGAVP